MEDVGVAGGRVLLSSTEVHHDVVLDGEGGQAGAGHGEETGLTGAAGYCTAVSWAALPSPLLWSAENQ